MKNKRNNFICIGAVHKDYLLLLKKKYFKYRTNPISQKESLGGVAYNIASKFAFLNQNVELFSINCDANIKNEIIKNNIKFTPLTRKKQDRSYTSILNSRSLKAVWDLTKEFKSLDSLVDDVISLSSFKKVSLDPIDSSLVINDLIETNDLNELMGTLIDLVVVNLYPFKTEAIDKELELLRKKHSIYRLKNYFSETFFETKKIICIPIKNRK